METPAVIYYLIATILVLTAAAANAQAPAFGVLFVVNSTGDDGDAAPGNGVCETATGNRICTLRAAIEEVVARNNGGDGININSSAVYLDGALPDITTSVSISGPGATKVIVEGPVIQFRGRVFNVTTSGTVSISGITIAYAFTPKGQNGRCYSKRQCRYGQRNKLHSFE